MVTIIPFGKHNGKSLERIAILEDYGWIHWAVTNKIIKSHTLKSKAEELIELLNHFIPEINCSAPNCTLKAKNLEISQVYSSGIYQPNTDDINYSCEEKDHTNYFNRNRTAIYPLKYDTITIMPPSPKYIRRELQKKLAKVAGFNVRATNPNLDDFVRSLKEKSNPQLSLF